MKLSLLLIIAALSTACHQRVTGGMGPKGEDGAPGSSCSITQTVNGAIINCTDGTSAVLFNGEDGADGAPAPTTPYTVTELINPCGDAPGFDEVLLRLHNGQVMAHYAQGALQFLTILSPGSYRTTDSQRCVFTLQADGTVVW